jgi:translation initiation factor 2 subunit 3
MTSNNETELITNFSNQPIINIGMLGSVSDGKSTTVYSLTGVKTQRHSDEMKRNITIKPGYANMKIYSTGEDYNTTGEGELVHHVSFIDCPGHYQLIVTMMSCIKLMDGIILVVSAAESIDKKPQLIQHIMAIKMSGIKNVIVLLNKLDLVKKSVAIERYKKLCEELNKYDIQPNAIIPVSMNHKIGVQNVLKNIMMYMGPNNNRKNDNPIFMISRSFDINRVNINYADINGGVIGGSLIGGNFKIGDEIEIQPGIISKGPDGELYNKPHYTKIISLKSETTELDTISAGGLIGIGTEIDPFYCKNDNMIGMIAGLKGCLPPVYYNITMNYKKINFDEDNEIYKRKKMTIIVGTNNLDGEIINIDENYISLKLNKPACISSNSIIILCHKSSNSFQIAAYGYLEEHEFEVKEAVAVAIISALSIITNSESDVDVDDI